jgi:DNA-directed RNA polymerase subunit M/transcription elongation factor TFIIS
MTKFKSVKAEIGPNKFLCRKCRSDEIEYYESDGDYEDTRYMCKDCNHSWWVEGSDY